MAPEESVERGMPRIAVLNGQTKYPLHSARLKKVARDALERLGLRPDTLSLVFVGRRRIESLNRRFRGKPYPTDVLSFGDSGIPGHLGDVVISLPDAARNAAREGHPLAWELSCLVIHGILHLAGYDHEQDRGEMDKIELRLRKHLLGS